MAISVGPNIGKPTHHVKLTRGGVELGLLLCDQRGKFDLRVSRDPFPSTAIKTYSGDAKHSDREPPFKEDIQQDWSLGRGQEVFEDDKSRYQDGQAADTTLQGKIILGPQPTFSTGIRKWGGYMPGSVVFKGLYGTQRYMQRGWTLPAGGGFLADKAEILLRKKGTPNSGVTIQLRDTTLGTTHKTIVISAAEITTDTLSVWALGNWATTHTLNSSVEYRLVVFATSGSDDVDNCWEIGSEAYVATSLNSSKSSDGSSWTSTSTSWGIYFRVVDTDADFTAHFIEYREQLYFATSPDSGAAAKLYMNGFRGAADDNTGELNKLKDAAGGASWGTAPGAIAKLVSGNAFQEKQNWRRITGGGVGYVTVSPNWNIIQDIYDEYVMLGSDVWTERAQAVLSKPCTDVEVANDIMYIAQGADTPMYIHREKNNNGTFQYVDNGIKYWYQAGADVDFVLAVQDYISGPVLYLARNSGWSAGDGLIFRENAPVAWKESPIGFLVLVDGKSSFNEQVISNVTVSYNNQIAKIAVGEPFTTGVIASKEVSGGADIRFASFTNLMIKSSVDLAAGVLEIVFDDTANCVSPVYSVALPYMKAGLWLNELWLPFDVAGIAGSEAIVSVGFRITQDVITAFDIELWGGLRVYTLGSTDPISIPDTKITGLERYNEPETCWVMAEDQIGEIRNNYYQPIPLRELESVRSGDNGKAHLVHDVYLYFSLKDGVDKYYRQHLDDMGPNRDMGLPNDRQGPIVCMVGYPGRIYAAVDGGDDGYGSVFCYNSGGWHEIYRSRFIGRRIRKLYIQSVPGYIHSRLWISEGSDILWIPIAINPLRDANFKYIHESAVISSRIYGGLQDVAKFFKSVKLATRNLTTGIEVQVDYRTDVNTAWTRVVGAYDSSPYEEQNLSSAYDVSGRWIELRTVLQTNNNTITPEIFAWVLKAIEREEGKYANTYTFRVKDWDRDIMGNPLDYTVSSFMSSLETMINSPLPLLMNSISELDDNQYVVAQPASLKRLRVIPEEDGREVHICQLTLLEI